MKTSRFGLVVSMFLGASLSACSQLPSPTLPEAEEPSAAPIAPEEPSAPPQFVEMSWVDEGNTLRVPTTSVKQQAMKAPVANSHKGSLSAAPTPPKK